MVGHALPCAGLCMGAVGVGCVLLSGESNGSIYNALNEVHDNLICTSINTIYCRVCS